MKQITYAGWWRRSPNMYQREAPGWRGFVSVISIELGVIVLGLLAFVLWSL